MQTIFERIRCWKMAGGRPRGCNFPGNQQSRETGNTGNPDFFSGREIREIGKWILLNKPKITTYLLQKKYSSVSFFANLALE